MAKDVEELEPLYAAWEEVKWYNHFEKEPGSSSKSETELPPYPGIVLLAVHLRDRNTYVHTKTCRQTFAAVLVTIAKRWKKHECPSADECNMIYANDGILFDHKKE